MTDLHHVSDCCHAPVTVALHRRWRRDIYRCTRCLRICGARRGGQP